MVTPYEYKRVMFGKRPRSVVFSFIPVSFDALSINVSSIFSVVLMRGHLTIICINMHL